MRPHGGSGPASGEDLLGVRETLEVYAEDIGVPCNQVRTNRQTASKWPAEQRVAGTSFEIHRILEKLEDRFERIAKPPEHPRDGVPRWTQDAAKRQFGWRVDNTQSVQEKVRFPRRYRSLKGTTPHEPAAQHQVVVRGRRSASCCLRPPAPAPDPDLRRSSARQEKP